MEAEKLTYLLKHPTLVEESDISKLHTLIDNHPYFQAPKALQLKALKNSGSFVYNQKLKETAAYTTDREILFHFISSDTFNKSTISTGDINVSEMEEIKKPPIPEAEFIITNEEANQISDKELFQPPNITLAASNDTETEIMLEPQTPLEFSPQETHSFTEWLRLTKAKPIIRDAPPKKKKLIESPLIDTFLKNNPKIQPVKKSAPITNLAIQNHLKTEDLMTETLAKVYLAQGNYKKAIQAYKILSLKNPEKSGLFADQIRAVKKLRDNNQ